MVTQDYELELEKVASAIKKSKSRYVLIQLPDGLKPNATEIAESLKNTGAKIYFWAGSCFGFCDIPNVKNIDMLVQFGHNKFIR